MRKLYVKRQRALACFSVTYHCILGQSQEDHLRWVREQSRPELMRSREPGGMRAVGEGALLYSSRGLLLVGADGTLQRD